MTAPQSTDRRSGRRRVLIVDDNDDTREMYAAYFFLLDLDVATASDGAEALRIAAELKPDVILMDLTMPVMDGWTATRHLKADTQLRAIPVVAVTAARREESDARAAGFARYIVKPCSPEDLADVVFELLA